MSLIPLLSTFPLLEVPSYDPKIHENVWVSYSTENFYFTNMSTFTPTKQCLWSNAWRLLAIQTKALICHKNASSIGHAFSSLFYMDFSYSFTITLLCHITWKYWGKCKEEQLSGYWGPSKHLHSLASKPLLVLYPLSSISRNLVEDHNYKHIHFSQITSSNLSWSCPMAHSWLNILPCSNPSPDISIQLSKAT